MCRPRCEAVWLPLMLSTTAIPAHPVEGSSPPSPQLRSCFRAQWRGNLLPDGRTREPELKMPSFCASSAQYAEHSQAPSSRYRRGLCGPRQVDDLSPTGKSGAVQRIRVMPTRVAPGVVVCTQSAGTATGTERVPGELGAPDRPLCRRPGRTATSTSTKDCTVRRTHKLRYQRVQRLI